MPESNPNQSLPTPSPESMPTPPPSAAETVAPVTPEAPLIETAPGGQETMRPNTEVGAQNAGAPPPVVDLPTPISPTAPAAPAPTTDTNASDDSHPAVADDVDVIEKEWVQKAKSIVEDHRSDPYMQEEEANKLQSSYLKKRYGKIIKKG